MRLNLLNVVCCPLCRNRLEVSTALRGDAQDLLDGSLQCSGCKHEFAVEGGIPDLLPGTQHKATASAFSFQWQFSFRRKFETGTLYGYDVRGLVDWVFTNCFTPVKRGDWLLDAGCGRGDKTIEIARRHPEGQVIGLDLTNTLPLSRKAAEGIGNVDFVRGDLMKPPIRDGVIAKAMSWGVLHHTPDTSQAFHSLARTISPTGELAAWLYPHPSDSNIFDMAYEMRDVHFFGRGHRIPKPLLLAVLPFYLVLTAPYFLLRYGNPLKDSRVVRSYLIMDGLPLAQKARTAVFIYLDNLIPEFQDRPARSLVNEWYADSGFGPVAWNEPGLFWAAKRAKA
jgi:uncharacterized protein YbaR (Trm112 family)/SAM-dependent methyltransferase